ncbi:MAG: hypothetical protein GEU80_10145 [Dehalococcoidia bacterium]|nr:hypothetical protein [Dehalococcoidia bacterium]
MAGAAALFAALACVDGTEPVETPTVLATVPAEVRTPTATPESSDTPATPTPTPDDVVASTFDIPREELPVIEFIRLDGGVVRLPVEVPPREEYPVGLSGRYALEERGMLFYYPEGRGAGGFWMKDTHIDLSIAFVDAAGEILEILEMEAESLDVRSPGETYQAVIEAPAGWYEEHGIRAGDEIRFDFEIPEHLAGN